MESAEKFATANGFTKAYATYDELLSDPLVDVVYNPLPNELHCEWTIKALQAGKHVLCEKPLSVSVEEVDKMYAAADASGKVLAEAFMYAFHPKIARIREIIASGAIGEVRQVVGDFSFVLHDYTNIRARPGVVGSGSLWDVGCYPISFARLVLGQDPVEVQGWALPDHNGVENTFNGHARFSSGAVLQFHSSMSQPFHNSAAIYGTKGTIKVPNAFKGCNDGFEVVYEDRTEPVAAPSPHMYHGELATLAAIVHGDTEEKAAALAVVKAVRDMSRGNIAAILAFEQSARDNGAPKKL
jgi:D-xylose 1-dehydrogenase (NADP+, D-xylono-1,5-lactone-forming)